MSATVLDEYGLPLNGKGRWTYLRKVLLLKLIANSTITAAIACARYDISQEELDDWQQKLDATGAKSLRRDDISASRYQR
jgi:hypothetical protein